MIFQIIFILISILLLCIFIAPLFMNICNIGNITGIIISSVFLISSIFYRHIFNGILYLKHSLMGTIIISIISIIIAAMILFAVFLSIGMAKAYQNPPENPCTVVILGCSVKGTRPSVMLRRRLEAAAKYLNENPDVFCIVSGGQGNGEDISEAEAMKIWLIENGIQKERILMEDKSTNTKENLKFSKDILEKNGLPLDITIVTDGFHQYRAYLIAKEYGLNSWSVSGTTRKILIPTYWVREWLGLAEQILL